MRSGLAAVLLLGLGACSSSASESPKPLACPDGYAERGGACVLKLDDCADGDLPKAGGGCLPIGARACGEGFTLAKSSGCTPVLPATACPKGQMAIPGEAACRPVAECGEGTWGKIPVDATTVYVDGAYAGADADGTVAHPFATIQRGLDAARPDAMVAVAAGEYREDLRIRAPLRLYGVCPQKVAIAGVSATFTLDVSADAEISGVAVTGPTVALGAYAARVTARQVWVHDAGEWGVDVEDSASRAGELLLVDSLVERSGLIGAFSTGSTLRIERSVVRDTRASKKGQPTDGVLARATADTKRPSNLSISRSVVSGNAHYGVLVNASAGLIEDSYVTDTRGVEGGAAGGLSAHDLDAGVPEPKTSLVVRRTVVDKAYGVGLDVLHGALTIEDLTIRHIDGIRPGAILLEGSSGTLTGVTIEDVVGNGLALGRGLVEGGFVDVRALLVRRVAPMSDGVGGVGLFMQGPPNPGSKLALSESMITDVHSVGIVVASNTATIHDSFVGRVSQDTKGQYGDGITVIAGRSPDGAVEPGVVEVVRTVVKGAVRVGLAAFGGEASVQGSLFCAGTDLQIVNHYALEPDVPLDGEGFIHDLGANACGCAAPHACRAEFGAIAPVRSPW